MSGHLANAKKGCAWLWGRSGSKHLMHHTTRGRMPEAVRGWAEPTASAHQSAAFPGCGLVSFFAHGFSGHRDEVH